MFEFSTGRLQPIEETRDGVGRNVRHARLLHRSGLIDEERDAENARLRLRRLRRRLPGIALGNESAGRLGGRTF